MLLKWFRLRARFQIDRALERFQTRMDKGVSDWDLMPTTPAGCDEFESRLSESDPNSDDNNSPSELSELDSVGSNDLTPSEFGDESQEESDEEVAWVWSLRLTGLEWKMWTRLGNIVYRAHAEFEHVGDFQSVQYGAWLLHRTGGIEDEQLPTVLNEEWSITSAHPVGGWTQIPEPSRGQMRLSLKDMMGSSCALSSRPRGISHL